MSFFINDALAQGAGESGGFDITAILPLILMFGIFYFLLIRPQQKKSKEHKNLVAALKKGDEIITNGGLLSNVSNVEDNFLTCEIADKVEVRIQSHAVTTVLPKGTIKSL